MKVSVLWDSVVHECSALVTVSSSIRNLFSLFLKLCTLRTVFYSRWTEMHLSSFLYGCNTSKEFDYRSPAARSVHEGTLVLYKAKGITPQRVTVYLIISFATRYQDECKILTHAVTRGDCPHTSHHAVKLSSRRPIFNNPAVLLVFVVCEILLCVQWQFIRFISSTLRQLMQLLLFLWGCNAGTKFPLRTRNLCVFLCLYLWEHVWAHAGLSCHTEHLEVLASEVNYY